MSSIIVRFLVILGVLWVSLDALAPTYNWYFRLTDEQKALANTSRKEFQKLTQSIEMDAQIVRQAMGEEGTYKVATSVKKQKDGEFALDLAPDNNTYIVNLEYNQLKTLISEKLNPDYSNFNLLEKSYKNLQKNLQEFALIKDNQAIKNKVIKLGLDIAGGVHFSLAVDQEKMIQLLEEQYKPLLDRNSIRTALLSKDPKLSGKDLENQIQSKINELNNEKQEKLKMQKEQGIDQALMKIRNRVDQFGVAEPIILKGPNDTIVVELAGEKDTESAKEIFTRVGVLSFQIVDEALMDTIPLDKRSYSGFVIDPEYIKHQSSKISKFLPVQGTDKFGQSVDEGYLSVLNTVELTGDHIANAQVETNQMGQRTISFRLDSRGADIFGELTQNNVGKRLAIVLDGRIQSAPSIREAILGGSGSISGSFTLKEANLLSTILRSGSLPVPLKIEEERIIGPSLGQEEITKAIHAAIMALCVVMIFMFIYYGVWGGLSNNLAQLFNIVMILAVMAQMGATLTLPGLAAIVLTIGMSVDANIIIHERIKEDLKNGFSLPAALVSGYQAAFTTILDSNTTTFIPGLILGSIGDGPIRGFGVTLMIGLVINLFTAIFCTRVFYDLVINQFKIKNIFWSRFYGEK